MLKRIVPAVAALGFLAACGGPVSDEAGYDRPMSEPAPVMEEMSYGGAAKMAADAYSEPMPGSDRADAVPGAEQYIAYSHSLGLRLPEGGVDKMMQSHVEACRSAGTSTCIVVNSNIYNANEDYVSGNVSLRATPAWIEGFLSNIDKATEEAGGDVTSRATSSEDLTRTIIDTASRLEAQRTLQGRLQGLLERRDGTLGDLLEIERELARVTGDIESIEAQLKALRLRVSMSSLDVSYETKLPAFSGSESNPLGEAFGSFFHNLASALAAVITAFAVGLPWLILLGIFLWIWLKLVWPGIRRKRPGKS